MGGHKDHAEGWVRVGKIHGPFVGAEISQKLFVDVGYRGEIPWPIYR